MDHFEILLLKNIETNYYYIFYLFMKEVNYLDILVLNIDIEEIIEKSCMSYLNDRLYNNNLKYLMSQYIAIPSLHTITSNNINQFQYPSTNRKLLFIQLKQILHIKALSHLQIDYKINKAKIHISFIQNSSLPMKVESKAMRILTCRYFNRLNSSNKYGNFKINPFTGIFEYVQYVSELKVFALEKDEKEVIKYIKEQQINVAYEYLMRHLLKILNKIGNVDKKLNPNILTCQKQQVEVKQIKKKSEKLLDQIITYLPLKKLEYKFMFDNGVKPNNLSSIEWDQILKKNKHYFQRCKHKTKQSRKKLQQYKAFLQSKIQYPPNLDRYEQQELIKINNKEIRRKLRDILIRQQDKGGQNIICDIYLWQYKDNTIIATTGFSKIYKRKIQQQERKIKDIVIKKAKLSHYQNKIANQKKMYKLMADSKCKNIVNCYQITNIDYLSRFQQPRITMDFYKTSLEQYQSNNKNTISLFTKLNLLFQIVQGLRFLRDNKIVHLDIKPLNILIDNNLVVKLTDLGQSYHKQVRTNDFKPGFTMPYSPPQLFYEKPIFDQKLDVYSLGMMIHQILFQSYPVNIRRLYNDSLASEYKTYQHNKNKSINQKIKTLPEKYKYYGPQKLMQILANICLSCLSIEKDERPYLDWILIFLKISIEYLTQQQRDCS